jgi:hypothetical protein
MATAFKEGDRVRVADREATADDAKAVLFFNHFRGLTGTIQKVYAEQHAAVEIDNESLPEPILRRHIEVQETMKAGWLDKLSDEARNRLTDQERDFRLRYTVLVALNDLAPGGERPERAATVGSGERTTEVAARVPDAGADVGVARRATSSDLEAAEEAELLRRRGNREG